MPASTTLCTSTELRRDCMGLILWMSDDLAFNAELRRTRTCLQIQPIIYRVVRLGSVVIQVHPSAGRQNSFRWYQSPGFGTIQYSSRHRATCLCSLHREYQRYSRYHEHVVHVVGDVQAAAATHGLLVHTVLRTFELHSVPFREHRACISRSKKLLCEVHV